MENNKKVELIIAEKPAAAKKIAYAIGNNVSVLRHNNIPYYRFELDDKIVYVASAVGHLFTLEEREKSWEWPSFDIEWKELYKVNKAQAYSKDYLDLLKQLIEKADEITIATDYDIEGELIGYNVLRFVAGKKNAYRMKFSTLTPQELRQAYENKLSEIDLHNALAGETRHVVDWYYGINLSRALMSAIRKAGKFSVLSTGRVQGPALNILVERENEIENFEPKIFYSIIATLKANMTFEAKHEKEKIEDETKAKEIYEKIKNEKKAKVVELDVNETQMFAPVPFDLTTLQSEAYRIYKIKPQETLDIAQKLYLNSYISYPRTSSQQLDPKINFKKIISNLIKMNQFKEAQFLLNQHLRPRNGSKTDPAHPAIYPTGILPKSLSQREFQVYNLIVRRFLATFYEPALKQVTSAKFKIKDEIFKASFQKILKKSWLSIYPFINIDELDVKLKENEDVDIVKIKLKKSKTKPPSRYTQAALVKELERRNLGTKATRANIVETLYERKYVHGDPIKVTELGKAVVETLKKYVPKIVDEAMTRELELKMDEIKNETDMNKIIKDTKKILTEILNEFKKKEITIGKELLNSLNQAIESTLAIGKCPKCGGNLIVKQGRNRPYIACDNCKYVIFVGGGIKRILKKKCSCGFKLVTVRVGKKSYHVCFNENCKENKPEEVKFYVHYNDSYDSAINNSQKSSESKKDNV